MAWKKGKTPNPQEFAQMFPTPRAKESGNYQYSGGDHNRKVLTLSGAAKMLPTPTARAHKAKSNSENRQGSADLQTIVAMFTTPCAGDAVGTHGGGQGASLRTDVGGQLNPDWVEWLMGFPPGWTDLDTPHVSPVKTDGWWDIEPDIPRVAVGVKGRVNRLKSLGNAVVPHQAYPIFKAIAEIEHSQT